MPDLVSALALTVALVAPGEVPIQRPRGTSRGPSTHAPAPTPAAQAPSRAQPPSGGAPGEPTAPAVLVPAPEGPRAPAAPERPPAPALEVPDAQAPASSPPARDPAPQAPEGPALGSTSAPRPSAPPPPADTPPLPLPPPKRSLVLLIMGSVMTGVGLVGVSLGGLIFEAGRHSFRFSTALFLLPWGLSFMGGGALATVVGVPILAVGAHRERRYLAWERTHGLALTPRVFRHGAGLGLSTRF